VPDTADAAGQNGPRASAQTEDQQTTCRRSSSGSTAFMPGLGSRASKDRFVDGLYCAQVWGRTNEQMMADFLSWTAAISPMKGGRGPALQLTFLINQGGAVVAPRFTTPPVRAGAASPRPARRHILSPKAPRKGRSRAVVQSLARGRGARARGDRGSSPGHPPRAGKSVHGWGH